MAEPQDTSPKAPADDLDARIAAVEQYLATAQSAPPSASPASIDFAGGTIIHVPLFGSFHITSETASQTGVFVLAGLLLFGVLFLSLHRLRHPRHEPK
jgi:hypothetical protein